jgi:hypothetical protein
MANVTGVHPSYVTISYRWVRQFTYGPEVTCHRKLSNYSLSTSLVECKKATWRPWKHFNFAIIFLVITNAGQEMTYFVLA